jgi:dipeptidyl-peptidase-4
MRTRFPWRLALDCWILAIVLCSTTARADDVSLDLLDIDRIFASNEFRVDDIDPIWMPDGSYTTLEPSVDPAGGVDIVRHDPGSREGSVLVPSGALVPSGSASPLAVEAYSFSPKLDRLLIYTNSKRVWRHNTRGDYWVLDRSSRELRKLGGDASASSLMFAEFSPSGRRVAFVRERDIWVEDLVDRTITRLTKSDSAHTTNGTFDWVYEEELDLRKGWVWNPDEKSIAFWQIDSSGVRLFPLVNTTDTLYPEITWIPYPKTGEKNSAARIGVVSVESGTIEWIAVPGDEREHYLSRLEWTPSGRFVVIEQLDRRQQTLRLFAAEPEKNSVREVLVERDEAWIDTTRHLHWLRRGDAFLWLSERDGWRHAWIVDFETGQASLVTPGDYDVVQIVSVDEARNLLWFIASPSEPNRRYLYRSGFDGRDLRRVTPADATGTHRYDVSPDAGFAFHRHSSFATPPVIELIRLPEHETVRVVHDNSRLRDVLGSLRRGSSAFGRLDAGHGLELDAWWMLPPDFDPLKKYPVIVHVYGEPWGQTVVDDWMASGYLWHLLLTQRGYVVASFDNRGTPAPRGRAWRKSVYRKVGILAPIDQAGALRAFAAANPWVDSERIGIWGWSGGGSMTLNAMFKFPDLYRVGISIAPVPNQRLYDTIYQERYMGLPDENVDGYIEGSPIHFAKNLRGDLLLIHGSGDDNCHYQGTEALMNELVRHDRPFDVMVYPNRSHAIREGKGTTLHLRRSMLRYFETRLAPGPRDR